MSSAGVHGGTAASDAGKGPATASNRHDAEPTLFKDRQWVVFTDLDGTLLDHSTYAWSEALPGLQLARRHRIPLVFCSSKTRAEQEYYREAMGVHDPFIVENGGAVCIPEGYFPTEPGDCRRDGGLLLRELGRPYGEILKGWAKVRRAGFADVLGYADLCETALMPLLGLDAAAVARAGRREYEETLVSALSPGRVEAMRTALAREGLTLVAGGRFHGVSAGNDKGRAVRALAELYRRHWPQLVTVGIGDSWNDAPMLDAVDRPFLVQRPGGTWEDLPVDGVRCVPGVGPRGWTRVMRELVGDTPSCE